jgi:hypothetical protein
VQLVAVELRAQGLGVVSDTDAVAPIPTAERPIVSAKPFISVTVIVLEAVAPAATGPKGSGFAVTVKARRRVKGSHGLVEGARPRVVFPLYVAWKLYDPAANLPVDLELGTAPVVLSLTV